MINVRTQKETCNENTEVRCAGGVEMNTSNAILGVWHVKRGSKLLGYNIQI